MADKKIVPGAVAVTGTRKAWNCKATDAGLQGSGLSGLATRLVVQTHP